MRFTPQAWINDQAIAVDPAGPPAFTVPTADAQDSSGAWLPDHSGESDRLKDHENAPEWIRSHSGPFEITIDRDADGATP